MFARNRSHPWILAPLLAFGIIAVCSMFSNTAAAQPPDRTNAPQALVSVEAPVMVFKPAGEVVQIDAVFAEPPSLVTETASPFRTTFSALLLIGLIGLLMVGLSIAISRLCAHHFS